MSHQGGRPRVRMFLAGHPDIANRLFNMLGAKTLDRMGKRAALRAARQAFLRVPLYQALYHSAGFDERRMRHLTWDEFVRLPTVGKPDIAGIPEQDLLDATVPFPAGDAIVTRSSGTTGKPTIVPTGWDEFYLTYAVFRQVIQSLHGDRSKTLVLLAFGVDGNPTAGGISLRCFFAIKQDTHWPFEICAAGETSDSIISFLRFYAENQFENLYIMAFPGTMERVLDVLQQLTAQDPNAGVDWKRFRRKHIQLTGQVVSRELQERIRRELEIPEEDLAAIEVLLGSSDSGQVVSRSSPFTCWLERYMEHHPDIAEELGIPEEHRTKSLMEFVPPAAIYLENDADAGLLLTTWKHRPLIRFRSNDLAWVKPSREVVQTLNRSAKGWRKDFSSYGLRKSDIPRAVALGMILGRADDVCIVNGANVTPDVLRDALAQAGILPQIYHFKHRNGQSPNEYDVFLELPDQREPIARDLLAAQWLPGLLEALVTHPSAIELQAAHRGSPIDLQLVVRSRGEAEFAGDDQRVKKRYTAVAETTR
jgi:phenylacetate-coenzyme A ligase PaaK-like adenylate-forming protein